MAMDNAMAVKETPSVYAPTPYLNGPRHTYLAMCVPDVNPRILSRMVDLSMRRCQPPLRHYPPPYLPLKEAAPDVGVPVGTRVSTSIGRRSLSGLVQLLDSEDNEVVLNAIIDIGDAVVDQEKVCAAVRLHLASKILRLMENPDPRIRECSCRALTTLASRAVGREMVLEEPGAMFALKRVMFDVMAPVRYSAALTMRMLARFRLGPYDMDELDLAPFLARLLRWETHPEVIEVHLASLVYLLEMEETKKKCIEEDAFFSLTWLMQMDYPPEMAWRSMDCIARLASCDLGKSACDDMQLLSNSNLQYMLASKTADIQRAAARVMNNLTLSNRGKTNAIKEGMLPILLEVAQHPINPSAQLYAMQALVNLSVHPDGQRQLRVVEDELEELEVGSDETEAVRGRLLAAVRREP